MTKANAKVLARQPFEEKIRKVGQLFQLSAAVNEQRVREIDDAESTRGALTILSPIQMLNVFRIKGIRDMIRLVLGGGSYDLDGKNQSFILTLDSDVMCQIDGEPYPISKGLHHIDFIGKLKVLGI